MVIVGKAKFRGQGPKFRGQGPNIRGPGGFWALPTKIRGQGSKIVGRAKKFVVKAQKLVVMRIIRRNFVFLNVMGTPGGWAFFEVPSLGLFSLILTVLHRIFRTPLL